MPQLPELGEVKRINLPSTASLPPEQQAYVLLQSGRVLGGDLAHIDDPSKGGMSVALSILAGRIKEWNFTDAQGQTVPITVDNVSRLEGEDLSALFNELDLNNVASPLAGDQKKSS